MITDLFKDYGKFDDDKQVLVVSKDSLRKVMQGAGCNPTLTDVENILRENKLDSESISCGIRTILKHLNTYGYTVVDQYW